MASTLNADNGVVSGSAGLKSSADSSGVLVLQTNGTNAVTVGTDQNVTLAGNITLNNGAADGAQLTLASAGYSNWNIDNYSGRFRWYYNVTEYMTLDASGNLGLGTTSPTSYGTGYSVFEVAGSATGVINVKSGSTLYGQISNSTNQFKLDAVGASSSLLFLTNTTERARIDTSGNLLVGTTNSSNTSGTGLKFSANGLAASVIANSGTASDTWNVYNTTAGAFRFYVTNGGTIFATSTTISAISDERLKENVRDLEFGLPEVMALKPRRFDWKEGKGQDKKNAAGFIAQEFETVFPASVGLSKAGEDGVEYKNINHEELIPTLVKAIQEQQAIITQLQADVAALKGQA